MTGLDVFDTTIHKTNSWLKETMEELGIDNRHQAYQALRGILAQRPPEYHPCQEHQGHQVAQAEALHHPRLHHSGWSGLTPCSRLSKPQLPPPLKESSTSPLQDFWTCFHH
jgi:hypothetical protein